MADFQIGEMSGDSLPTLQGVHRWRSGMSPSIPYSHPPSPGAALLLRSAQLWYATAALGQLAFIWFIVAHYWRSTLVGELAAWNDKPLITGYVAGDLAGNLMFAVHVLLAAIVTLGGLLQLVPRVRLRLPALHRWNGRVFLVTAFMMALGGLWLVWVRGTRLSLLAAVPLTLDALLMLAFGAIAWRCARDRRFEVHRRWALRTFIVANGVWFLRVAMMAWVVLNQGPRGLTSDMSGPVDLALQFGCYLVPLGVLELYLRAQRSTNATTRRAVAALVMLMTAVMATGIFGTIALMWWPYF
jgi:hypothetical protein